MPWGKGNSLSDLSGMPQRARRAEVGRGETPKFAGNLHLLALPTNPVTPVSPPGHSSPAKQQPPKCPALSRAVPSPTMPFSLLCGDQSPSFRSLLVRQALSSGPGQQTGIWTASHHS